MGSEESREADDAPLREEDVCREDRLDDKVEEGAELPTQEEDEE